jgi:predicted RNA-binding Zn-ribbon protein involved in translation (DUF1610 family)
MTAAIFAPERRVSGVADDRRFLGRGGRRANDDETSALAERVACQACGIAWASLRSFRSQRGRFSATYVCPRCGHLVERVAGV